MEKDKKMKIILEITALLLGHQLSAPEAFDIILTKLSADVLALISMNQGTLDIPEELQRFICNRVFDNFKAITEYGINYMEKRG